MGPELRVEIEFVLISGLHSALPTDGIHRLTTYGAVRRSRGQYLGRWWAARKKEDLLYHRRHSEALSAGVQFHPVCHSHLDSSHFDSAIIYVGVLFIWRESHSPSGFTPRCWAVIVLLLCCVWRAAAWLPQGLA